MTVRDLENLYEYGCWANNKLFRVILQLTPAEFTQPVAGSYGSVRTTMAHIMSAEWAWLDRCGGTPRESEVNPADFPTAESLISRWNDVERYVRSFLSQLQDEDLLQDATYTGGISGTCNMPVGELMHHTFNHATHHRGQVALLLRVLGYTPGDFDLLFYYAEKRNVPAW